MSAGGYGGGGWGGGPGGPPPGGYGPPPGGGYGQPPGGGYGQPPGGGFGQPPPPPQGAPPGWGPPPPNWGAPPPPPAAPGGAGRFVKDAVIGGAVGGVLSAIPVLGALNCCFCMLNMIGAGVAVGSYLRSHPGESLSAGDAALCGVIAGAIAGFLSSVLEFMLHLVLGTLLSEIMLPVWRSMPASPFMMRFMLHRSANIAMSLPLTVALFAAFGALGAFLTMQLFYKDRLRT